MNGCLFSVWLVFAENQLYEIELQAYGGKGLLGDNCLGIKDVLAEKYGRPEQMFPGKVGYEWTVGETRISFQQMRSRADRFWFILDYTDKDILTRHSKPSKERL